jgi:hypothetical protein
MRGETVEISTRIIETVSLKFASPCIIIKFK